MDITPLFNDALAKNNAPVIPIGRKPPPPADEFLKEAYTIVRNTSKWKHVLDKLGRVILTARNIGITYIHTLSVPSFNKTVISFDSQSSTTFQNPPHKQRIIYIAIRWVGG